MHRRSAHKKMIVFLSAAALLLLFASVCVAGIKKIFPLDHLDLIYACSREYDLQPAFICAVIHAESKFRTGAVSGKGASGLMQITEPTANWLAEKMQLPNYEYSQIASPELNIRMGCYYLHYLAGRYDGDLDLALAAYNAGGGNVAKWLNNPNYSDDGKQLHKIPYPETENYIARVTLNTKIYEWLLKFFGPND